MSTHINPTPAHSRRWDIVGIGDIDVDMFLGVTKLAGRDEKVPGLLLGEHPGGMIANVVCAASVLGASTAMIGRVGTDAYAEVALRDLRDFKVDDSMVTIVDGGRTFYCVIMLDESGEKALTAVLTDCHWPQRHDIDPEWFWATRMVHLAGDDLELAIWAAEEAHTRGALVSLDLEASTAVHGVSALRPLLASTDVLFINHSGCRLFDDDPVRAAELAHRTGPGVVVITQGARGVLASTGAEVLRVDALPAPVVDTTGAGDCFIGAFLTQLLVGHGIGEASRYAAAAASVSIGSVGSRTSLPDRGTVLALVDQAKVTHVRRGET